MINLINDYLKNNNEVNDINIYIVNPNSELFENINSIKTKYLNNIITVTIKYDILACVKNYYRFSDLEKMSLNNIIIKYVDKIMCDTIIVNNTIIYQNISSFSIQQNDLAVHDSQSFFTLEDFTNDYMSYIKSNYVNLFKNIIEFHYQDEINSKNIPQYSNFEYATFNGLKALKYSRLNGINFNKFGFLFLDSKPNDTALKKFGENHSKMLGLLDFFYISETSPRLIYTTSLGRYLIDNVELSDNSILNKILVIQFLKIPIIKHLYLNQQLDITSELKRYLSESTALRRTSNVKKIIEFININKALV